MITEVSLRLPYLIFVRVLGLVLLMGRTASALVLVTLDNDDQIKGDIWRELIALDATFGLPGKLTLDCKWHAGPSNKHLVAFGRKPSDRNPTGLQGFHARHLLVIIDECCGLPKELWDGADSLASNEGNDPRRWEPNGPDGVHGRGLQAGIGLGGPADPVDRHPRSPPASRCRTSCEVSWRPASGSTKAPDVGCDQPGVDVPHHRRVPRYQHRHPDHAEVD